MNKIEIPKTIIKKLIRGYSHSKSKNGGKRNDIRVFLEQQSKANSDLGNAVRDIINNNSFKNLVPRDIGLLLASCMDLFFRQRRGGDKICIDVFTDISSSAIETAWLDYTFTASVTEILKAGPLHNDVENIISGVLNYFENKYSKKSHTFVLRIKPDINNIKDTLEIDDRIKIESNNYLEFRGAYSGSPMMIDLKMSDDLNVILFLLEMENTISCDPRHIPAQNAIVNLEFGFPKSNTSILLKQLEQYFINDVAALKVGRSFGLPLRNFQLLSKKLDNSVLRTVLGFFDTQTYKLRGFSFLKYWFAVEIMLDSPQDNTGKMLEENFKKLFPNGDAQKIKHYWGMRGDIVHRGEKHIELHDLWGIENEAKNLFYRLLDQEIEK